MTETIKLGIDLRPIANKIVVAKINETLQEMKEKGFPIGEVSDGYHTFDELYEHRIVLWIALCKMSKHAGFVNPWRSKVHSDGSVMEGWFVLGMYVRPGDQMTYHLPMSEWINCEFADTMAKAPDFDGHTSSDVLKRLSEL